MSIGNGGEIEKVVHAKVVNQMLYNVDSSSSRKKTNDERDDGQKPTHLIGLIATDDAVKLLFPPQIFGDFFLLLCQSYLFERNQIWRWDRRGKKIRPAIFGKGWNKTKEDSF